MIFRKLWKLILSGKKTKTRRPAYLVKRFPHYYQVGRIISIQDENRRVRGYAIITDISFQRLGDITDEDAQAEGFNNREEFLLMWNELYPKSYSNPDFPVVVITFKLLWGQDSLDS